MPSRLSGVSLPLPRRHKSEPPATLVRNIIRETRDGGPRNTSKEKETRTPLLPALIAGERQSREVTHLPGGFNFVFNGELRHYRRNARPRQSIPADGNRFPGTDAIQPSSRRDLLFRVDCAGTFDATRRRGQVNHARAALLVLANLLWARAEAE